MRPSSGLRAACPPAGHLLVLRLLHNVQLWRSSLASPQCSRRVSCSSGIFIRRLHFTRFSAEAAQPPPTSRGSCGERQTMRVWQWTVQQVSPVTFFGLIIFTITILRLPPPINKQWLCVCFVCARAVTDYSKENQTCFNWKYRSWCYNANMHYNVDVRSTNVLCDRVENAGF